MLTHLIWYQSWTAAAVRIVSTVSTGSSRHTHHRKTAGHDVVMLFFSFETLILVNLEIIEYIFTSRRKESKDIARTLDICIRGYANRYKRKIHCQTQACKCVLPQRVPITKDPLPLTGQHNGGRRPIRYVLVCHMKDHHANA